jgi:hypothetical protein
MIWKYLTEHDARELTAWTNDKLDHEPVVVGDHMFFPWVADSDRKLIIAGDVPWISHSDRGWIVHDALPERGRPRDVAVWQAARDVGSIRHIWKQHKRFLESKFKHTQHRTGTITVTAEQIAADRNHVDIEAIRNRLHKKL